MSVEIANRCPAIRPDRAALARLVRGVLRLEGRSDVDVIVVLGDDALLRDLNGRFRGRDRATDVISFEPAPGQGPEDSMPGEIYLSCDRLAAQARRYRHSESAELARLLTHGALHVLGHDHHTAAERARMRARERECLRRLMRPGEPLLLRRSSAGRVSRGARRRRRTG